MNSAAPSPFRAWMVVAILWFVGCINYLDRVMITTMRGSIVDSIPMTDAQFGLLTSVFLLVYGVLSPFAGFLADRYNRSRVILVSLVAWSVITWMTAHATTFPQLLFTRALMGVSEACYIPAALAMIADYHQKGTRSLANSVHLTGVMVGSGLGGLGGWIAERHGWEYAFSIFGQIGIGLALVVGFFLRDHRPAKESALPATEKVSVSHALNSLFSRREFILALIYWGLLGAAVWATVGWMPTYLNEQFKLSQGEAGLSATGFLQGASLIGLLIGGAWADRWSRRHPRGPIFVVMVGLAVAAPSMFFATSTQVLPLALAALVMFGLTRSFADANMMPILTLISDPRYRATGYGVLNLCACLIGGASIYAGGWLRDSQISVVRIFQFGAACFVISLLLLFLIKPNAAKTSR